MKAELEEYMERKVASGEFQTRDEFLAATIAFYKDEEEWSGFQSMLESRIAAADRSEVVPWDINRLKAKLIQELASNG